MSQLPSVVKVVTASACFITASLAVTLSNTDLDTLAAHQANPRDTSISLQLGLEQERLGDLSQAESILLTAAHFDRQYLPAWTLANFYFRRENQPQFWAWAARASAINSNDFRPLLRLADAVTLDPDTLIAHLGDRPELLRAYLDLLIGQARFTDAQKVADHLRDHHDPSDLPRLQVVARLRTIPSPGAR